jgi:hypothetical protein
MRALWIVALASCTPDIATGAYFCGPEQSCPAGFECNGDDNRCVTPANVAPFACDPIDEHEPDNDLAHALAVGTLTCVSPPHNIDGCLAAGDAADWFAFDVPPDCTSVEANIELAFPLAWEPLAISVSANDGSVIGTDGDCDQAPPSGHQSRCLKVTLTPGSHYGTSVTPAGGGDCDGDCAFNRYTLTVRLDTP